MQSDNSIPDKFSYPVAAVVLLQQYNAFIVRVERIHITDDQGRLKQPSWLARNVSTTDVTAAVGWDRPYA